MKQYIVIGAGRFGTSLAKSLIASGQEVMVIDENEKIIQQLSETMDNVAVVSATDESALKNIGLSNFDVAIVCIGSDLRASIMATLVAKDVGVPVVISKATDKTQAEVLRKIGADRVVFPEHDMGVKLARALSFNNLVDFMELDESHSIFEITVPNDWIGSNLIVLNVREKYEVNIVAVKRGDTFEVPPDPYKTFTKNDVIVVAGKTKRLESIVGKASSEKW